MKPIVVLATLLLASTCSASYGALSSQYHTQDHLGHYSYGYADPNSQKHESRSPDGTTKGSYSYVDGHGHVQSVSYVADPHHGFHATGTNLPKGPAPLYPVAVAPLAYSHYAAPYAHHVPLTHQGVPVDTPEVQHAKAAHFAAHAAALSGHHHLYKRSLWAAHGAPWGYAAHVPVIHNGVPVETPEVQHAKAAHFAAHAQALGAAGHGHGAPIDTPEVQHAKAAHFAAHAAARSGHPAALVAHGYHIPVIHNGVPIDTPEVQHAKAAHFAAVAKASVHAGHADHYAPAHHHGPIHIPVIHNGVPVETPEVQHAKAAHFAAVAEASHRGYDHGHYDGHYDGHHDDGQYHHHHQHGW